MKKLLTSLAIAAMPLTALGQASGVTLNLEEVNPLSKWGRWTYFDQAGSGYVFSLSQNRGRMPLQAQWGSGDWVFKLNKDMLSDRHDLFFGLKVSDADLGVTSVGCMSNSLSSGLGDALCGVQLDMNLR